MFVSRPPKIHKLNPSPQGDGIRRWASGKWIGISARIKEVSQSPITPLPRDVTEKGTSYEAGSGFSPDTASAVAMILDFQPPDP